MLNILGLIIIGFGIYKLFTGTSIWAGIIIIIVGIFVLSREQDIKETKSEIDENRDSKVIDNYGGRENISINISKYSKEYQLILLKDNRLLLGKNDFKKIYKFNIEDIKKFKVNKKTFIEGNTNHRSNSKFRENIEYIQVFLYAEKPMQNETHEIKFQYKVYDTEDSQKNYTEILDKLDRIKDVIEDKNINVIYHNDNKSIPEK